MTKNPADVHGWLYEPIAIVQEKYGVGFFAVDQTKRVLISGFLCETIPAHLANRVHVDEDHIRIIRRFWNGTYGPAEKAVLAPIRLFEVAHALELSAYVEHSGSFAEPDEKRREEICRATGLEPQAVHYVYCGLQNDLNNIRAS